MNQQLYMIMFARVSDMYGTIKPAFICGNAIDLLFLGLLGLFDILVCHLDWIFILLEKFFVHHGRCRTTCTVRGDWLTHRTRTWCMKKKKFSSDPTRKPITVSGAHSFAPPAVHKEFHYLSMPDPNKELKLVG